LYISNSSLSIKKSNRSNGPSNCGNFIWYDVLFTFNWIYKNKSPAADKFTVTGPYKNKGKYVFKNSA
jgi:hypothetical protein